MKHTVTRTLYSYWTKLRGSRTAPDRREIEPSEIRHILGDTFIIEVQDPANFTFRLAGTRICSLFGRELKSRNILELWSRREREALQSVLMAIVEDGAAAVIGVNATNNRNQSANLEMIFLPLTHQGNERSRIVGSIVPMEHAYWMGVHPVMNQSVISMRIIWPDERPHFLDTGAPHASPAFGNFGHRILAAGDVPVKATGPRLSPVMLDSSLLDFDTAPSGRRAPEWSLPVPPKAMGQASAWRQVGHLTVIDGGKI